MSLLRVIVLILVVFIHANAVANMPKYITISEERLLDKIKGGWAGQVIGCTYGGPTEFKYTGGLIPDYTPIEWSPGHVKWWIDNS